MTGAVREAPPAATVIEDVLPQVDGGRFAIKRVVGEDVTVTAACFAHGHERVACVVRYRGPGDAKWHEVPMEALGNDAFRATFTVDRMGRWEYQVACWIDHLTAWRDAFARRVDADDVRLAARTPPRFPCPLPPYTGASPFSTSRHSPAHGTPTR